MHSIHVSQNAPQRSILLVRLRSDSWHYSGLCAGNLQLSAVGNKVYNKTNYEGSPLRTAFNRSTRALQDNTKRLHWRWYAGFTISISPTKTWRAIRRLHLAFLHIRNNVKSVKAKTNCHMPDFKHTHTKNYSEVYVTSITVGEDALRPTFAGVEPQRRISSMLRYPPTPDKGNWLKTSFKR